MFSIKCVLFYVLFEVIEAQKGEFTVDFCLIQKKKEEKKVADKKPKNPSFLSCAIHCALRHL
jgi:hypothetical protein